MHKFLAIFLFVAAAILCVAIQGEPQKPSPPAGSAEVSCSNPETQMEMNQCAAQRYKKADAQLNELYERLVRRFQKNITEAAQKKDSEQQRYEQSGLTQLRQAQRAWIRYRDAHCAAARQRYELGTISPTIYSNCMAELTEHRTEELKNAYSLEEDK